MNSKWQKILITLALSATLYNTLPSVFYYSKPLNGYINSQDAKKLNSSWNSNLKSTDAEFKTWLQSLASGFKLNLVSITETLKDGKILELVFKNEKEAQTFESKYNQATSFAPYPEFKALLISRNDNTVFLLKKFSTFQLQSTFYKPKKGENEKDCPYLVTDLKPLALEEKNSITYALSNLFKARSEELRAGNYPIVDGDAYEKLSLVEKESCFILHSPLLESQALSQKFTKDSIYLIAKNFEKLCKENEKATSKEAKLFNKDKEELSNLLSAFNFSKISTKDSKFENDQVFELKNFSYSTLSVFGYFQKLSEDGSFSVCPLPTYKEKIQIENKIDTKKQETLVQWHDDYFAQSNQLKSAGENLIAKPSKSAFISNLILNAKKYFRGDERKVVKFGLDLSGGKNVVLQLKDRQGKQVTSDEDIKQTINELYQRVNKLGVSEVSIRQEGNLISLDFPGSQNLSAKELISASSMNFHVVNEKFGPQNIELYPYVHDFLNHVWDKFRYGQNIDSALVQKVAFDLFNSKDLNLESIEKLKASGLKLACPEKDFSSDSLSKELSKVVILKQNKENQNESCPLMIVFNNFALEGSALKDIQVSYDPTKGNFLTFNVAKEIKKQNIALKPQENLGTWTENFCRKNKNSQTEFKAPRGWRMAVILNNEVVSAPFLEAAIKDSASITGSFSQKDLLNLKSDLQAGSLSFQPEIVYEQNVSAELGARDKTMGLLSMAISLALVSALMIGYYRFSGIVATFALIINLVMLWAASSYFNTTLSLASIAGIVLTLGMAVDANVLVFERMREETLKGSSLKECIFKGYQKATSAIIDSNLTTMIAAAVLLSFDAGPVKGFALTLLVGLITSMATALYMTRYYFFSWGQKTKVESLNFAKWFLSKPINFLTHAKKAMAISIAVILVGSFCFVKKADQIIGMDFKGGYALDLKIANEESASLKEAITSAFLKAGLKASHVHLRQMGKNSQFRLFLDKHVDGIKNPSEPWNRFIRKALKEVNLELDAACAKALDNQVTQISGQMSSAMKNQALVGLSVALVAIFAYVLYRFEWSYALASIMGLIHDVLFTLSCIGILAMFNVPISLDMSCIAAILTIIGYSLNDTIIVFDRIREEKGSYQSKNLYSLVNRSLNTTLSRTLLTSLTTLIVLVPMVILGSGTLFNFSLAMTIGVVFGTLSTLFIVSPFWLKLVSKKQTDVQMIIQ